jgi:putative transport protein
VISTLVGHPILLVFVVLAVGAALGAVQVRGVGLGPAGALFAGLALSAIDSRLAIPELVGTVGLALFTYTIGLASGPAFFGAVRTQGRTLGVVAAVLVIGGGASWATAEALGLSAGVRAGLFAGALTNTPALAAARDALHGSNDPVIGYSVAYPIGVLGMILAAAVALRMGARRPNDDDRAGAADLATLTVAVRGGVGIDLRELAARFGGRVVFARLERDGGQSVPPPDLVPLGGDLLSVVAPRDLHAELLEVLGAEAAVHIADDRSQLDMRRIAVSDRRLTGRRLGDLDLLGRFGAVATRVRRGDVDLLAHAELTLMPGDRVRLVAPRRTMPDLGRFFGDSERRIAEIDALGFMLGIAAGLLLGVVSIPVAGGHFSLGNAGGPLIAGLVLGRLERSGPFVWQPPYGANLALRQFGTLLFLGTVGSRSGDALVHALRSPQGAKLGASAVVVVAITAAVLLVAGRRWLGLGGARLAGVIAGFETQPAVLAFASEQSDDDRVSAAYALVFPLAMLVKIVLAQILSQL